MCYLLRRLRLPSPPSSRYCRCGRPSDCYGHHRASCAQAGVLGRHGCSQWRAQPRASAVRQEGESPPTALCATCNIGVPVNDGRRMKSCCGRTPCARWGPARRGHHARGQCCTVMGHHMEALVGAGSHDARRNEPTLRWSSQGTEPSWSCLRAKLRVFGLRRRSSKLGPEWNPSSSRRKGRNRYGA